jgi:hypothetical protein
VAETPVAEPVDDSGLPPILDADNKVAAVMNRFETDASGAIAELDEMRRTLAPHPLVLHAWTLCLHRAERIDEALAAAREALPLCLARGQVALAAEIYAALWKRAKELGLELEQIDVIAAALFKSDDLVKATSAYGWPRPWSAATQAIGTASIADHRMPRRAPEVRPHPPTAPVRLEHVRRGRSGAGRGRRAPPAPALIRPRAG